MSPELLHDDSLGTLNLFQIENQVPLATGLPGSHCLRQGSGCLHIRWCGQCAVNSQSDAAVASLSSHFLTSELIWGRNCA